MLSPAVLKKIRALEIYTRRLLSSSLVGDSRSALKGSGFEFDQIREYQLGDDVRFIDWNSSARMNKVLVKQYQEERSRTIIIAMDISSSGLFSSCDAMRADVFGQIASVLSLVANYGKDRVGLLLFSDRVDTYIPPQRGIAHVHTIMEKVMGTRPTQAQTRVASALDHLASLKVRDALVFLISDFIDDGFEKQLRLVAKKYDVVAVSCLDCNERAMPSIGFISVADVETGQECMLDARSGDSISSLLHKRIADQDHIFKRCGVDHLAIELDKPFMADLVKFFRRRMMY